MSPDNDVRASYMTCFSQMMAVVFIFIALYVRLPWLALLAMVPCGLFLVGTSNLFARILLRSLSQG